MSRASAYALRARDADFDADWRASLREAVLRLRDAAFELAVTPEEIPVFGRDGTLLHTRIKSNATLLMFLLRHYDRSSRADFSTPECTPDETQEHSFDDMLAMMQRNEDIDARMRAGDPDARAEAAAWLAMRAGGAAVQAMDGDAEAEPAPQAADINEAAIATHGDGIAPDGTASSDGTNAPLPADMEADDDAVDRRDWDDGYRADASTEDDDDADGDPVPSQDTYSFAVPQAEATRDEAVDDHVNEDASDSAGPLLKEVSICNAAPYLNRKARRAAEARDRARAGRA